MFNPSASIIQISTSNGKKDYLPVAARIQWFRESCPEGTIETEMLHLDLDRECEHEVSIWNDEKKRYEKIIKRAKGMCIFKATVSDGKGGKSTGTKQDNAASSSDWIECCETGAIGRALAGLGFGTQFIGDEQDRLADAPVSRPVTHKQLDPNRPCSDQQFTTINKLQKQLGMPLTDCHGLSYQDCAALIAELSKRVQSQKQPA